VVLPWQDLEILEAKTPVVTEVSPKIWFREDGLFALLIAGENLLPGASVVLRREDSPADAVAGVEVGTNDPGADLRRFSGPAPDPGLYALEVTNPGGLSYQVPRAVLVRPKLAAATDLRPPPGTRLGPADLRDQSLDFSWAPVAEASQYRFVLRRKSDAQVVLRLDSLEEPRCRIDDLTLLDRGNFEWTVEAQGSDPSRGVLPAASPARADFQIDLPPMTAPFVRPGDTFYGR
jgi:hypothetical protein